MSLAESFNRHFSCDRVLVENYFGKVAGLCVQLCSKWRLPQVINDGFLAFLDAFKIYHAEVSPLPAPDAFKFLENKNRLAFILNGSQQDHQGAL